MLARIPAGDATVPKTMDMLLQEHRNMGRLLDLLEGQLDILEKTEAPNYDLILEIIDYFRSFPDLHHHPKEDLIFKKLVKRDPGQAAKFGDLEAEHATCSDRLDEFARAVVITLLEAETPRTFVGLARAFIDHERHHIASEEKVLFPAAMRSLTDDDWAELDTRSTRFKDPLLEDNAAYRLGLIRRELAKGSGRTTARARASSG